MTSGFLELTVPDKVWDKISPTGDSGGLLCPACIIGAITQADPLWVNDGEPFNVVFESGHLVGQSLHFGSVAAQDGERIANQQEDNMWMKRIIRARRRVEP